MTRALTTSEVVEVETAITHAIGRTPRGYSQDAQAVYAYAIDWAADCEWSDCANVAYADNREYLESFEPSNFVKRAARHYDGGMAQLVADALRDAEAGTWRLTAPAKFAGGDSCKLVRVDEPSTEDDDTGGAIVTQDASGVRIHDLRAFCLGADTGTGYDYSQTHDVADGDLIVCEEDGRVIVAAMIVAWPTAIIGPCGQFHRLAWDGPSLRTIEDGKYAKSADVVARYFDVEGQLVPNPIVGTFPASDGGTIREYRNGMLDAIDGVAYSVSPGFKAIADLEAWIEASTFGVDLTATNAALTARDVELIEDAVARGEVGTARETMPAFPAEEAPSVRYLVVDRKQLPVWHVLGGPFTTRELGEEEASNWRGATDAYVVEDAFQPYAPTAEEDATLDVAAAMLEEDEPTTEAQLVAQTIEAFGEWIGIHSALDACETCWANGASDEHDGDAESPQGHFYRVDRWIVTTNSQGFKSIEEYANCTDAHDAFDATQHDYSEWARDDDFDAFAEELEPSCEHGWSHDCPDCDVPSYLPAILDTAPREDVLGVTERGLPAVGSVLPNGAIVIAIEGETSREGSYDSAIVMAYHTQEYVTWRLCLPSDREAFCVSGAYFALDVLAAAQSFAARSQAL